MMISVCFSWRRNFQSHGFQFTGSNGLVRFSATIFLILFPFLCSLIQWCAPIGRAYGALWMRHAKPEGLSVSLVKILLNSMRTKMRLKNTDWKVIGKQVNCFFTHATQSVLRSNTSSVFAYFPLYHQIWYALFWSQHRRADRWIFIGWTFIINTHSWWKDSIAFDIDECVSAFKLGPSMQHKCLAMRRKRAHQACKYWHTHTFLCFMHDSYWGYEVDSPSTSVAVIISTSLVHLNIPNRFRQQTLTTTDFNLLHRLSERFDGWKCDLSSATLEIFNWQLTFWL